MRNQAAWAKVHRNGYARARAIVVRQDMARFRTATPGEPKAYRRDREIARRKRQIDAGQLRPTS